MLCVKASPNTAARKSHDDRPLRYHRTLTSYFAAIRRAGFSVYALIEPVPSEEMLAKYPRFRDDLRMAHFVVFGCGRR